MLTVLLVTLLAAAAAWVVVPPLPTRRRLGRLEARSADAARRSSLPTSPPMTSTLRASRPGSADGEVTDSALRRQSSGRLGQRSRRRTRSRADPELGSSPAAPFLLSTTARTGMAVIAGFGVMAIVGGPTGMVAGTGTALALPHLIARLPDPMAANRERRLVEDLPLVLDLIASCLATGAPLPAAVQAVSVGLPGPLCAVLADVARQLELGAPPGTAWRRAEGLPPLLAMAETVTRVGNSGAALAPALRRLATEERERAHRAQEAAVRRVGVFVVIPLGVCFLPAFLLLGVVPIVAGLVGGLLP